MNVMDIWGLLLVVGGGFVATNLDNLVLLVLMLGVYPHQRAKVSLGYSSSAVCVLLVGAVAVVIGTVLDPAVVGYLGFAPLCIGLYLLFKLFRGKNITPISAEETRHLSSDGGFWRTFLLLLSNSGDSVAIFLPLLAESHREARFWIVGGFLFMVCLWVGAAWQIAGRPQLSRRIEQVGQQLVPWILVAVGLYILLDTGSDTMSLL